MRQIVFRSLAGVLAAVFVVALIFSPDRPAIKQLVGMISLAVLFGAYALLGGRAADTVIAALFGAQPPPDEPDEPA
jgi:hypothetical protein